MTLYPQQQFQHSYWLRVSLFDPKKFPMCALSLIQYLLVFSIQIISMQKAVINVLETMNCDLPTCTCLLALKIQNLFQIVIQII